MDEAKFWDINKTFVFFILGSCANAVSACYSHIIYDKLKVHKTTSLKSQALNDLKILEPAKMDNKLASIGPNTKKYLKYYLSSNAQFVEKLAKEFAGIPKENIQVFACEPKEKFEVFNLTGRKSIVQLGLNESGKPVIVISKDTTDCSSFSYFSNISELRQKIDNKIKNNTNARIILLLDDLSDSICKGNLTHLQIYLTFLTIPHKSIRIFNDSCSNKSMIESIQKYHELYHWIESADLNDYDLKSMYCQALYGRSVSGKNDSPLDMLKNELDFIQNLAKRGFNKNTFTGMRLIDKYFQSKDDIYNTLKDEDDISELTKIQANYLFLVDKLKGVNITTVKEFKHIGQFFDAYKNALQETNFDIKKVLEVFKYKQFENLQKLCAVNNIELGKFIDSVEFLFSQNISDDFDDELMPEENDLVIYSTVPSSTNGVTYSSIRYNDETKVVAGSPAMMAFIKEIFMNITTDRINAENVQREVRGEGEEVYQYPTLCHPKDNKLQRQWADLEIEKLEYGTISNERIWSKEVLESKPTIDEIIDKLGYEYFTLTEKDASRTRRRKIPLKDMKEMKKYESEDDDYYDSEDFYIGSTEFKMSDSDDEGVTTKTISNEKILKLREALHIPGDMWQHDVFYVFKYRFMHRLKKKGIPFDPDYNPPSDSKYTNFILRIHKRINDVLPTSCISKEFDMLIPKINVFVAENPLYADVIEDAIVKSFDDADRVVTPTFFPNSKTYNRD